MTIHMVHSHGFWGAPACFIARRFVQPHPLADISGNNRVLADGTDLAMAFSIALFVSNTIGSVFAHSQKLFSTRLSRTLNPIWLQFKLLRKMDSGP